MAAIEPDTVTNLSTGIFRLLVSCPYSSRILSRPSLRGNPRARGKGRGTAIDGYLTRDGFSGYTRYTGYLVFHGIDRVASETRSELAAFPDAAVSVALCLSPFPSLSLPLSPSFPASSRERGGRRRKRDTPRSLNYRCTQFAVPVKLAKFNIRMNPRIVGSPLVAAIDRGAADRRLGKRRRAVNDRGPRIVRSTRENRSIDVVRARRRHQ